jgi:hypothetical protein
MGVRHDSVPPRFIQCANLCVYMFLVFLDDYGLSCMDNIKYKCCETRI